MKKDFYVYEWFNVDTNEVFYVGKGRKSRYKSVSQRNRYFRNYYNKYKCDVRKVKTDLTEEEAFQLEKELIKTYREVNQCKCNLADGGEGCTFPKGSWNDMFRKLQYLGRWGTFSIMRNAEDYSPAKLRDKSLEELHYLYRDYREELEGFAWLRFLDIYDEDGDLNIGWECFED